MEGELNLTAAVGREGRRKATTTMESLSLCDDDDDG